MARRRGLRSEVLLSLALLMGTAILVLGALLLATHESHVRQLHALAARSLLADARSPLPQLPLSVPGMRWWWLDAAGASRPAARAPGRSIRNRSSWRPQARGGAGRCCARGGRGRRSALRPPSGRRKWRWRGSRRSLRPACSRRRCCARCASSPGSAPTCCARAWCGRSSSWRRRRARSPPASFARAPPSRARARRPRWRRPSMP